MRASRFDFVNTVVARRDLVVTSSEAHFCRLEPRGPGLAWHCDLDDGTPTDTDKNPASFVRWVCRDLRVRYPATEPLGPTLDVHQTGPHSDLGRLLQGLGRLTGLVPRPPPDGGIERRVVYTDPAGILDDALRQRIENWPSAPHGDDRVVRPAELWKIKRTHEGLVVESVGWWDGAPALDHQIGLAGDIGRRLTARL